MKKKRKTSVCSRFDASDIAAYADRVLTAADRNNFEKHLLVCPACRDAVRGLEYDLASMKNPDPVAELLRLLLPLRIVSVGLTRSGLNPAPADGIVPEFAPAVRGADGPVIRIVLIPFATPRCAGACRLRFRDSSSALLECRLDRSPGGPNRLRLSREGRLLEEKIFAGRSAASSQFEEFSPVSKGRYEFWINGRKVLRLRIV